MAFDPAVLRDSFAVVERRADHVAKYFYAHLFTHNPGVRALFPDDMADQRDRLFAALTQLVLRLENPEQLTAYLGALGRDHRKFEALEGHYPAVGASLIAALRHFSGSAWTPEVEKTWSEAYSVISQAMIDAARAVDPGEPAWWNARVAARRRAAPDVVVLTLAPDRPYPFTAGQYLTVCSPRSSRIWRPYTIANAPRADGTVDLHVRRIPRGQLSGALVDQVGTGEWLRLGPPLGDAVLDPDSRRPLLLVVGGTGWAQARALLEQVAQSPRPTLAFVGARSDADLYDLDRVRELVERHPWLEVVLAAPADGAGREEAARLMRDGLAERGSWEGYDVHLSGPPDLVPSLVPLLLSRDAPPDRIRHDPVPAPGEPRPLTPADWFLTRRDVPWINRTDLGHA
ncbi:globin domain-containing protein [Peterkaempfera bronchialis]|uniref:nitric oxide dioxygenase n=1 Tax=Peterkaempfera bronchialis TaxID=2126346 RepID=A0A345SYD3_9ACTN|nr:globin domain-containing protein [Peterkaempfera bronchialis]AXI78738.1 flavohemoprotein [Peterkaempfera bronchialis]